MTETLGRMGRPQKFGRSRKHYGHSIPRRINSIDQTVDHLVRQRLLHEHHMPKVYEVTTKHEITALQVEKLLSGVVLDDSPKPVQAAACEKVSDTHLKLTLTEGKYHQVKRMLAAVGNRVEGLHRSAIGHLQLPADLAPGQWRWILPSELEKYFKA